MPAWCGAQREANVIHPSFAFRRAALAVFIFLGVDFRGAAGTETGWLAVENLRCEYRENPLGIEARQPRLSWWLTSSERGQYQTAYRILAATSRDSLIQQTGDLWDSGKVAASNSVNIAYAGKALTSGQRVYWEVQVWDRAGRETSFSPPAWWEMGLLQPKDWQAEWITTSRTALSARGEEPAPLFRHEFTVNEKVVSARAYVSGLGYYELYLNGNRVGDQVLDPGWTSYAKRVLYATYDVTDQIKSGRNAVGMMAGNGWFNPLPLKMWGRLNLRDYLTTGNPQVILRLVIRMADGKQKIIVTDGHWKTHDGPIVRDSVYEGETQDARREQPGWDRAGFDDARWQTAMPVAQPLGPLMAQSAPPIRITRHIQPVKLSEPKRGVYIFDMGQNFAGWVRLLVHGEAGTHVRLRYGELLYPDGSLNGMTSVCGQIKNGSGAGPDGLPATAFQTDEFILRGGGEEVFNPHFTFHGFRYVEVTGLTETPVLTTLEGLGLNSEVTPAGSFECSNDWLNQIQAMVVRTELSNLFSVESDCPHREKFGYGGDMVAASEAAIMNFDMSRFYAKSVQDLADAARTNGGFTETAPYVGLSDEGLGGDSGPVGWGTAQPQLQWLLYQYYGDKRLLQEQYPATKKWITFLQSCASNNILDNGISDHESLAPKPRALTGTAFYYLNLQLFAKIARVLGNETDAVEAEAVAARVKDAFNKRFLDASTGQYDFGSQACQAFPLYLGLVSAGQKALAMRVLTRDILDKNQGHLSTGIFGTKYMLDALTANGRADAAYEMVNQTTFPGWGYMLANGATTLWEHWAFSDNVYSHNHPMFGSVSEWFYRALGGINVAPDAVGFDRVIIRPQPVGGLQWANASYVSVRGKITSRWKRSGHNFHLEVTIPVGILATVCIPARDSAGVTESGEALSRASDVQFVEAADGLVTVRVGSGTYQFDSVLN